MNLPERIEALLRTQPQKTQAIVSDRFYGFWGDVASEPGECADAFNKLLPSGSFSRKLQSNDPPVFEGQANEATIAAAVLAKIFAIEVDGMRSGWRGLNKDAKGWCRKLLDSVPAEKLSAEELLDIVIAKTFIGMLVDIPNGPRTITLPDSPSSRPGVITNSDGIDS